MKKKQALRRFYEYCESIPDRLYPFTSNIEGKFVRGYTSYKQTVERAKEKYGPNALGYRIEFYRAAWHFVGSVMLIIASTFIAKHLFGSETALYVLLVTAIVALFIQEFISHPSRYNQPMRKNFTDWLVWTLPVVAYLFWL